MEAIRHPGRVIDNVLRAAEELGRTMYDAFAGLAQRGEAVAAAVALAGPRVGRAMRSILEGAWEVGGGLLGLVVGVLVNALGTFRPLAASERGELQLVFGGSRDPDRVFVSTEDPLSTVPFGIQDFFFGNPDCQALATTNLIEDVDDALEIDDAGTMGLPRATFVHEPTHVRQADHVGPVYMTDGVHAQAVEAGHDYGYDEGTAAETAAVDHEPSCAQTEVRDAGRIAGLDGGLSPGRGGPLAVRPQAASSNRDASLRPQPARLTAAARGRP